MNRTTDVLPVSGAVPSMDRRFDLGESQQLVPHLVRYQQIIMRWRWAIAGILAGTFLLGLLIALVVPQRYTAMAQIEIEREQKQITNVQGLDPNDNAEDLEFYATQYSLLGARPVIAEVAKRLSLYDNDQFFIAHGVDHNDALDGEYNLSDQRRRALVERFVIELLEDNVIIDPVRTSRLVDIGYSSRSPEMSAAIANAWTGAFIKVNMDRQYASTADARRILEDRLDTLRKRLEETERDVITYASEEDIVNLDRVRDDAGRTVETRTLIATDLEAANSALNQAKAARAAAQARVTGNGADTAESVQSEALAALRAKRAQLEADYAELMMNFEPGYPSALANRRQLSAIERAIAEETLRISNSRRQEFREAVGREQELNSRVEQLKQRLDRQQRASITYTVLQRERDTNRQLYDALLQRYKEIGVAGTVGISNISVVEEATVPLDPSFPNIPLFIALSLLAGTMLATAAIFALEHTDEGIREPNEVELVLGVPLLGYTPLIEGDLLAALADTKSAYYEANFSLQTSLAFTTSHGVPHSLAITSTQPNEGKSNISLGLAVALGRIGKKVLLVDGDMRSPSLHGLLGQGNDHGLSNFLAGEDGWADWVEESRFRNVSLLSAGPIPPNAAELLSGERLTSLVSVAIGSYDHIIFDAPPMLGLSDAPTLARAVEGAVFVAEARSAPKRVMQRAIARLRASQAHVIGAVLTKFHDERDGLRYGHAYGFSYGEDTKEAGTSK